MATRNHRTEAIDASALQESMVSIDFGASELGVATASATAGRMLGVVIDAALSANSMKTKTQTSRFS